MVKVGRKKGKPKTGGRKPGTPNKCGAEVRVYAQEFGEDAISILADLMYKSEDEKTRIMAAKEILDRAYGRASQAMQLTSELDMTKPAAEMSDMETARLAAYLMLEADDRLQAKIHKTGNNGATKHD